LPDTKSKPTEPESNLNETIEQIFGIVARRRWWILTAACCIPIVVVAVLLMIPNRYVSEATLLVVQQQVSQRYVEQESNTTIPAAVEAMKLEVLSGNQLIGIINDLGLYADAKDRAPVTLVEQMRKDIEITPLATVPGRSDFDAFTISFTASTPHVAQEVTSRLTSLFIEQNLKTRGEQATNTTKFLSEQLDAAKQRLAQQEERLQAFKSANSGALPEQQQVNIAALTDARVHLATVTDSLLRAQQRQASLESSLDDRIAHLQSEKTELLTHYTPQYPEVIKKDGEIGKIQAALDRLKAGTSMAGRTQDADSQDDPALAGILRQAEANAAEIESLTKQQQRLTAESEKYQTRLNLTPIREQQLAQILRDYDLFRQDYLDLQKNTMQSQMTTSLEETQGGQQFRLVDPPTLPVTPSSPKRLKISLGGMAGGLLLGVVLAFLIDGRDTSFHSEKTLAQSFPVPLVLGVPLVITLAERRGRGWKTAFEWLAACTLTVAMFAVEFYVFQNS